ncbi:phosphotransferase [Propionibacteriaceae bacterium Y1685]|uniref:phosphotransferase n=1 Tax=Microlunatus sp. Y1700 TaxID=3418487 RepID=UPI003B79FEA0
MARSRYVPTDDQQDRLATWLPSARVVADHSWGLVERVVWEIECPTGRFIAKIGSPRDHHMAREIHAHLNWLTPWTSRGLAPELVHHDLEATMLVTRFLPGELVLGTEHADDPDVFEQAGALLALLHDQPGAVDDDHEARENRKSLAWLDREHRINPDDVVRLRDQIGRWPTPPTALVPTHGDWQPRNWLIHRGQVRVIDFGRAQLQPTMADLARIEVQDFARNPDLERAFLRGYGRDPRTPDAWHRIRVRNAIGTAAWAHTVGATDFEEQGLRMVADVLAVCD